MKKWMSSVLAFALLVPALFSQAQENKPKPQSPPATVSGTIGSTTIRIDYGQPSVRGREIGKDLEPMDGKVWRTGANNATVFETDKDIKVEGKTLAKGKYALFTIREGNDWTFIFNSKWKQWGAFTYKEEEDVLRVKVKGTADGPMAESLLFTISPKGLVTLSWGMLRASFQVQE